MFECVDKGLGGVRVLTPRWFGDGRGGFQECYKRRDFVALGIACEFVQDNYSRSTRHVLRGLHYQIRQPQAKLVWVLSGEIFDVAVDIRRGSPTFGRWAGETLSAANHRIMFVPEGFAHGFCVCSDQADVLYKCSDYYAPEAECGIAWNDPAIGIAWPLPAGTAPILSARDGRHPALADAPAGDLPLWQGPTA